jgi:DNA helicase-2/ATP-dependent DNA helicase PcrA
MLRFAHDFDHSGIIYLEDNYRSTGAILSAATHLIAHNKERYGKVLRPQQTTGEKVKVQGLWDSREEAAHVAETVLSWQSNNRPLNSMAILVRTMAQTREFEERFALHNIPYHLVGNTKFYDRLEIRDVVAYLRVVHSAFDNIAFERILGTPKRGIGDSTLQALYHLVSDHDGSLERAARAWRDELKEGSIKRSLSSLLHSIDEWRSLVPGLDVKNLAQKILKESGYEAMWLAQGVQGEARLDNIKELIQSMNTQTSLAEFLDHVSILTQVTGDQRQEGVAIMTLHAAKGLEFDHVFLPGWEEGMFPHIRAIEESGKKGVEEERRLAYVGLTRARRVAVITFSWNRRSHQGWMPASPSRFIQELPSQDVDLCLKLHQRAPNASVADQKKVIHSVFGQGVVQSQQGSMVSVHFEKHGVKKLIDRFLTFL